MVLPPLKIPQDKNELYMQFVSTEYNCRYCPDGNQTIQPSLTSHATWLYQSVQNLQKGDIFMVGGDFWFFDSDPNNPYYPGGFYKALVQAMDRGALVMGIVDEYDIGDFSNECREKKGLYPFFCQGTVDLVKGLQRDGKGNFYAYVIPGDPYLHSHTKLISFYLKSQNIISVFQGSWNLNTLPNGNGMKETGFGITATLDSDFAQYWLYRDLAIVKYLEDSRRIQKKISPLLETMILPLYQDKPPIQPVVVPKVFFQGPNYCDENFGCGATGPRSADRDITCIENEEFTIGVDTNVAFTFGLDPQPRNWDVQNKYLTSMVWGADVLTDLIKKSTRFVKTSIHSQTLDESNIIPEIREALFQQLRNKVPWFCLSNKVWDNYGNNLVNDIRNDPRLWPHMYPKVFRVCGRYSQQAFGCPKETCKPSKDKTCSCGWKAVQPDDDNSNIDINIALTHDKLWITDKGFLLSSAHPDILHYDQQLINTDLMVENAPNLLNFVNNHWNQLWTNCGEYTNFSGLRPDPNDHPYFYDLRELTCPDPAQNVRGCCQNSSIRSLTKNLIRDPFFSTWCANCSQEKSDRCCLECQNDQCPPTEVQSREDFRYTHTQSVSHPAWVITFFVLAGVFLVLSFVSYTVPRLQKSSILWLLLSLIFIVLGLIFLFR